MCRSSIYCSLCRNIFTRNKTDICFFYTRHYFILSFVIIKITFKEEGCFFCAFRRFWIATICKFFNNGNFIIKFWSKGFFCSHIVFVFYNKFYSRASCCSLTIVQCNIKRTCFCFTIKQWLISLSIPFIHINFIWTISYICNIKCYF